MNRLSIAFAALVVAFPSTPLAAQGAPKSAQLELAKEAEKLKPGQWVWKPQIAPRGPILVYVDLTRQLATVYRNGVRIGVSTISSGRAGFETPTDGYTTANLSIAWKPLRGSDNLTVMLQGDNLFDVTRRAHASFTKDFAPLSGRNVKLSVRVSL